MRISDWSSDVCSSDLWPWVVVTSPPYWPSRVKWMVATRRSAISMSGLSCPGECPHGRLEANPGATPGRPQARSEEHTSELQSLMRNSYAVFCLKPKYTTHNKYTK